MNLIVAVILVAGWYFLLTFFPGLHHSVAFHALGSTVSWFAVLMMVGTAFGLKVAFSK